MQVEADVRAVRDENALAGCAETLGLELGQFLEETRDVDNGTGADQVDTFRRDEAGGQDVEVVGDVVVDDCVAGVWIERAGSCQSLS